MALAAALAAAACGSGDARPPPTRPGAPVAATSAEVGHTSAVSDVHHRSRFEIAVDIPARTLAPDDVRVEARFTAPSGAVITTGGFASHGSHHVRFTPREVGVYDYVVRADGGDGLHEVARGQVRATPGRAGGFIGLDAADHHRLARENGEPVYVLGENRIDLGAIPGELDTQAYLERMAGEGMRTVRVVVPSSCESAATRASSPPGCLEPAAGRFDERTADAMDALFDGAERSHVDVVLVAFSRGGNGSARLPAEMFTSPSQRADAARRLRYIADRWGASPRLLALELLDAPEADDVVAESTWRPWAEAMRDAWRSTDPYGHLLTTGLAGLRAGDDVVGLHVHGKAHEPAHARALAASRGVAEVYGLGKPITCADFAEAGDDETSRDRTHDGLWSLVFSGAGALVPHGARFDVLSEFLRAFHVAPVAPAHDVIVSRGKARAWSLVTPDALARGFWLLGGPEGYGRAVSGVEIALPAPPAGRYVVTWIDDQTGKLVARSSLSSRGSGDVRVQVPAFTRHIAARMSRDVPSAEH